MDCFYACSGFKIRGNGSDMLPEALQDLCATPDQAPTQHERPQAVSPARTVVYSEIGLGISFGLGSRTYFGHEIYENVDISTPDFFSRRGPP